MQRTWKKVAIVMLLALVLLGAPAASQAEETHAAEADASASFYRLGRWANWLFWSFLPDESDDASSLGLEFESYLTLGSYQIKNISYFEVAQYPRAIPGQPPGNPEPSIEAADGIGDLLTAFWLSKAGEHHGEHHFAPGLAMQFPTASDETLGSGKWSIGPSFDYEYESGQFFAGAIALQIWSFAGDSERKSVSMLMIKPFAYYTFAENWDLMYVPYGITAYWNKPSGEQWYVPLGGGVQRGFQFDSVRLNLSTQLFRNVVRPTAGTETDLRFLIELSF